MNKLILIASLLLVSACNSTQNIVYVTPATKDYTALQQETAANELAACGNPPTISIMLEDYSNLVKGINEAKE